MKNARTVAAALFAAAGLWCASAQGDAKGGTKGGAKAKAPLSFAARPANGTKARCPVAGEEFTVKEKTVCTTHEGRHYCFCCADCKPDFEKNPAKFAENKSVESKQ